MIYITGDCHGEWDRFSMENFQEQKVMTRDDYVIVCGDFGIWDDSPRERWWLDWFEKKNFTLLFCDGNHENFDQLATYEVVPFHGGKAHRIRDNIYHLIRGYVFDLGGRSFFVFGGARSHDIQDGILDVRDFSSAAKMRAAFRRRIASGQRLRINHESWWEEEMPSQSEMDRGLESLRAVENRVDFLVSHCGPHVVASQILHKHIEPDPLTQYFDRLVQSVTFTKWFFGHYHDNRNIMEKFVLIYEQIIRIL